MQLLRSRLNIIDLVLWCYEPSKPVIGKFIKSKNFSTIIIRTLAYLLKAINL
jgi:hypothetical protein